VEPLPSGNVTFLFADVEGSTRLFQRFGEVYVTALERYRLVIRAAIAAHHGVEVKTEGDGFFVAFAAATDAIGAMVAAQIALAETDWPEGCEIRARFGSHTGVAKPDAHNDYSALAVHLAARVCGAAHGGQILVSADTARLARHALGPGVSLADRGVWMLAGFDEPEHIYQVLHPDLGSAFPPLRASAIPAIADGAGPVVLPTFRTTLVGRVTDASALGDAVADSRIVTVTGVGGAGKTRLAVLTASVLAAKFQGGVWFVDLVPVIRPELVGEAVAAAVGDGLAGGTADLVGWVVAFLADRTALIVLDNCEHLIEACADLVDRLVDGCPNVRVVATSREALGVAGERLWPIPPLDVGVSGDDPTHAIELFEQRARAVMPGFVVVEDDRAAVTEICVRLDGLPLAIELAAAQITALSPQQLARRLRDRLQLSGVTSRGRPDRHETLAATIDWSYQLLDAAARRLLQRLSVFRGSFTVDAIEGICTDDDADLLSALKRLIAASLVVSDPGGPVRRCRLLETVRAFAAERLDGAGDAEAVRDWYLAWIEDFDLDEGLFSISTAQAVVDELDNLRAAMDRAESQGQPDLSARIAVRMTGMYTQYERHEEGAARLGRLGRRADLEAELRASCLTSASLIGTIALRPEYYLFGDALELDPNGPLAPLAMTQAAVSRLVMGPGGRDERLERLQRILGPTYNVRRLVRDADQHPRCTRGMRLYARSTLLCRELYAVVDFKHSSAAPTEPARALATLADQAEPGFDTLNAYIAIAVAHLFADDPEAALAAAHHLVGVGPMGLIMGGVLAGVAYAQRGDCTASLTALVQAGSIALRTSIPSMVAEALTGFAVLAYYRQDLAAAARLFAIAGRNRHPATAALRLNYERQLPENLSTEELAAAKGGARLTAADALRAEIDAAQAP
jgi:predicted ATPase/class 3 adenylate cyclase